MKKELKSGILSADKSGILSADKSAYSRPTVGGVNVIAVLHPCIINDTSNVTDRVFAVFLLLLLLLFVICCCCCCLLLLVVFLLQKTGGGIKFVFTVDFAVNEMRN